MINILANKTLEKTFVKYGRSIYRTIKQLPATIKFSPLSPIQAVKLSQLYPGLNENEDLINEIDALVGEDLLNCEYPETVNYLIPAMTEANLYIIGTLIKISDNREEFVNLIEECSIECEVNSYIKLIELVEEKEKVSVDVMKHFISIDTPTLSTKTHKDERGKHTKFFEKEIADNYGFNSINELFFTSNNKGTLRGLHRQTGEFPQQKLIKAITGSFNVRVIFPSQECLWASFYSKNADKIKKTEDGTVIAYYDNINVDSDPIFVPENALLGYVALEDSSIMLYAADNPFQGQDDEGFHYESFNKELDWGIDTPILSQRDLDAELF